MAGACNRREVWIIEHLPDQEGQWGACSKENQDYDEVARCVLRASLTLGVSVVVPCRDAIDLILRRAIDLVAHCADWFGARECE